MNFKAYDIFDKGMYHYGLNQDWYKEGECNGDIIQDVYTDNERGIVIITNRHVLDMHHEQDCCEDVYIDTIDGDLNSLIGATIVELREDTSRPTEADNREHDADQSTTWTFYNLITDKEDINIRWFGESNGYYSEEASLFVAPLQSNTFGEL